MRPALAAALLTLALVMVAVLIPMPDGVGDGTYAVRITGPAGDIWNGTVDAEATAWGGLVAAAQQGGFTVTHAGRGATLFVTSIDGHTNDGAGGWCFATGDPWYYPGVSAALAQVEERLWWSFHARGCPGLS